jgi:ribonucleoside-diphosphate reductase alpha chain
MSLKALSDYTIYAKYARYLPDMFRRETWEEQVNRVFSMHERKFAEILESNPEFRDEFEFAKRQVLKKRVLGSQRSLQFGGPQIEKHNAKMYNCAFGYIDRLEAFNEAFYLLLCGVGVGFSVQKHHVEELPKLHSLGPEDEKIEFVIEDSIEGWSDSIAALLSTYCKNGKFPELFGKFVKFDYSKIRAEGELISGGFKAPGPKGLAASLEKIRSLLDMCAGRKESPKMKPIEAYDILMHMSDAVLSGGVRRSATICLFSPDDEEMMHAKIGDWFKTNPQRARSNNSALLVRGETTREEFAKLMKCTKEFGEPGFIWAEDKNIGFNPCAEIGLYPKTIDGRSGFQFCNLTEINGKWCDSKENFLKACRASAIIGTLQASYTDFKYVSSATKEITEYESLLGCSITGMMDNPDVLFDPAIQRAGAKEIIRVNETIAGMIGIRPAARVTAVKPAGTTSCVLSTASGIHPHHARRYMRRVQANYLEFPVRKFAEENPLAVEDSVWSNNNTDKVITFLCEVPPGAVVKNQLGACELLEKVKLTQQNWIEAGTVAERCRVPYIRHNVSNTVTVMDHEWDDVETYIYRNRQWFAGISLLPASGDKDYPQAPLTTVHTPKEIVREYGDASVFASGLIVDGLKAFNNNLWDACNCVLGIGEILEDEMELPEEPIRPRKNGYTPEQYSRRLVRYAGSLEKYYAASEAYDKWWYKREWIRRATGFAEKYFDGDLRRMTYCLKDVNNWKVWCDLHREYKEIDWSEVQELEAHYESVDTMGAQACAGGKCDITF